MHSEPKVKELLKNFIPVKLGTKSPETKDLQVKYIPLMIFYNPKGEEIKRQVGCPKTEDLIALLESMLK